MSIEANTDAGAGLPIPVLPVICDSCRAQGKAGEGQFGGVGDILNFEPVVRRQQVGNWTAEQQRAFIVALAITGSPKRAGVAIGRDDRGATKLRTAKGGESFSKAWDAALAISREREKATERERMAGRIAAPVPGGGSRDAQDDSDPDSQGRAFEEARERIRDKLLRARRIYLRTICDDEEKQAAWEILVGPVDWEKAAALKPQDNEPYQPRMMEPDMLMTAEGGCLHEGIGAGRDRQEELREAFEEVDAGVVDGPKARRFFERDA